MEEQPDHLIRSPQKILSKLAILQKNKNILTAWFGEQGNSFVTTILEVNRKDNVFICDGCNETMLGQVLNSPKISFKTEHLGALVAFDATNIVKTQYQGFLAFAIPVPASMHWLEQREYYRVKVPMLNPGLCQLTLKGQEPIQLKLHDISIRGFSLMNASDEISELLVPGAQFEKCKLVLENKEEVAVSFEIRNKITINSNNLNKTEKVGCKFTEITPTFENTIHGYMLDIEREILKKRSE
jgi:flagellar brake protein